MPAHQSLETGHRLLLEVDDRLIVKLELFLIDRCPYVHLELPSRDVHLLAAGLKEGDDAATRRLGAVKRQIGTLQKVFCVRPVRGRQGDADAGPARNFLTECTMGFRHGSQDALREFFRIGRLSARLQHGKLVAT